MSKKGHPYGRWQETPSQIAMQETRGLASPRLDKDGEVSVMVSSLRSKKPSKVRRRVRRRRGVGLKGLLLGTTVGHAIILVSTAISLVFSGAILWKLTGGTEEYKDEWRQAFWLSWIVFADPGSQTSLSPTEKFWPQVVAVAFSICGFVFNLLVLGLIVDIARHYLAHWKIMYGTLVLHDHVVILGWTDKTLFLLENLLTMLDKMGSKSSIAVLGDLSESDMNLEVATHLKHLKHLLHRVHVMRGKTSEVESLKRLCLASARVVMILGDSAKPHRSDAVGLSTLLALSAMTAVDLSLDGLVVAEVQKQQNLDVITGLFSGSSQIDVVGVMTTIVANQVMALLALEPCVGLCALAVCDYNGEWIDASDDVYTLYMEGQGFYNASAALPDAVVFGLIERSGNLIFAPPAHRKLHRGERLLYLHNTDKLERTSACAYASDRLCCRRPRQARRFDLSPAMMINQSRLVRGKPHVRPLRPEPVVVILIGWRMGMGSMLRAIDARVVAGSAVHILSRKDAAWRDKILSSGGLQDKKLNNVTLHHHYGYPTSSADIARLPFIEASAVIIFHDIHEDDASSILNDSNAQLHDSEVIISCELTQQARSDQVRRCDARNKVKPLCCVVQFVDVLTFNMFRKKQDLLESAVADKDDDVTVIPFHRNSIETGALCMASVLPALGRALELMVGLEVHLKDIGGEMEDKTLVADVSAVDIELVLSPEEKKILGTEDVASFGLRGTVHHQHQKYTTQDVTHKLDPSKSAISFNGVSSRALRGGIGIVIGWFRPRGRTRFQSTGGRGELPGLTINPRDKDKKVDWKRGDKLLILVGSEPPVWPETE